MNQAATFTPQPMVEMIIGGGTPLVLYALCWFWDSAIFQHISDGWTTALSSLALGSATIACTVPLITMVKVLANRQRLMRNKQTWEWSPKSLLLALEPALDSRDEAHNTLTASACTTAVLGAFIGCIATVIMLGTSQVIDEPGQFLVGLIAVATMKLLTANVWKHLTANYIRQMTAHLLNVREQNLPKLSHRPSISTITLATTTLLAAELVTWKEFSVLSTLASVVLAGVIVAATEFVAEQTVSRSLDPDALQALGKKIRRPTPAPPSRQPNLTKTRPSKVSGHI